MRGRLRHYVWLAGLLAVASGPWSGAARAAKIEVQADKPGIAVSPTLYGIFFEEINRAGDGGLYAEMLQNRSFEDVTSPVLGVRNSDIPPGWQLRLTPGARASMTLDDSLPLNSKNPHSLKLTITALGEGGAAVANIGFKHWDAGRAQQAAEWGAVNGIAVEKGKRYDFSMYARAAGMNGPLTVRILKQNGEALAEREFKGIGAAWQKFEGTLKASGTDANARLEVLAAEPGSLWLDMVSLFPRDTFNHRKNGMRADLARMIAEMKPAFVRFPGGCFVEGDTLSLATNWKNTIGDVAKRPVHWNLWGYTSESGFGYHEFLQFCEDIKAEPLYVINCGMSHEQQHHQNSRDLKVNVQSYVQDALDALEYANGPAGSKWGALRAKAGHPKPFNLKLMEIGNENGGPVYNENFKLFHDAIKAKYPEVKLIACDWNGRPDASLLDIADEHYYNSPAFFFRQTDKYDSYSRAGSKVYVGEYAVTRECGLGNLIGAVGEAAFMTGLERNADVVSMASYAPLFVNPEWKSWNPNAIVFDSSRAYGIPSYHIQKMFANNRADRILPVKVSAQPLPKDAPSGSIGFRVRNAQVEFKDIKVTQGGKTLYASDFAKGLAGWKIGKGQWEARDGVLRQSGAAIDGASISLIEGKNWSNYSLSLKARRTGGNEGFVVASFQKSDERGAGFDWLLGGWQNTTFLLMGSDVEESQVKTGLDQNRWHDLRVELKDGKILCHMDGKLFQQAKILPPPPSLFSVAGRDEKTNDIVLKVVNAAPAAQNAEIDINGAGELKGKAVATVLTSAQPTDENSFAEPAKVAPREETLTDAGPRFTRVFPPCSVTILRIKEKR